MKTTILILVLFLFSFSIGSNEPSEDVALEQANEIITFTVHHYTGTGSEYVVLELPIEAAWVHLYHGDYVCLPPCRP
jgi:hypothetical protein